MKTKTKTEEQYQLLRERFNELRLEEPELESFRILTRVVMGGGYSAGTITRGVNRLVNEDDFCTDPYCSGCASHYDKKTLAAWLHHLAWPRVLKVMQLTKEEVMKMRATEEEEDNYYSG